VLGLNDTQESSLGLVFHYADSAGLALLDLKDLRAVIQYLVSDEGKADLASLGGLSSATAGVILRELIGLSDKGGDVFFGEPEWETKELLRTSGDKGVISAIELTNLQDRPQLFSTFLMWLLADLFHELPEVGDVDKPKLVFFFDEAHLLFEGASKAFLDAVTQTVRLIRSKGVGIFFVTQNPKDVPDDVLGQLGNRVQHALRAFTPDDAAALAKAVKTYPKTKDYDLSEDLTQLGTGEAIITVLSETGAPTPVAWTRLRPPRSLMGQIEASAQQQAGRVVAAAGDLRSGRRPRVGLREARGEAGAGAEGRRRTEAGCPGRGAPPWRQGGRRRGSPRRTARLVGVQVVHPLGRQRPGSRDHPRRLRRPQAPLARPDFGSEAPIYGASEPKSAGGGGAQLIDAVRSAEATFPGTTSYRAKVRVKRPVPAVSERRVIA